MEYDYQTEKVSRVVIYSLWTGVGTSNLEPEVLSVVNQANDEQFWQNFRGSEGDFWLETVLPFSTQLDVNFFATTFQWFEERIRFLLTYFQDYLQNNRFLLKHCSIERAQDLFGQ